MRITSINNRKAMKFNRLNVIPVSAWFQSVIQEYRNKKSLERRKAIQEKPIFKVEVMK